MGSKHIRSFAQAFQAQKKFRTWIQGPKKVPHTVSKHKKNSTHGFQAQKKNSTHGLQAQKNLWTWILCAEHFAFLKLPAMSALQVDTKSKGAVS